MSREARKYNEFGLYHIYFRGINHCHLFEEKSDYTRFIDIIIKVKEQVNFDIYAYCLMSNHVHLFIHENKLGDISLIMKKILTTYVGWFNKKYERSGPLVANRYKSECVMNDRYLLSLVRYIHQNPIKAGITNKLEEYKWSSYSEYITGKEALTSCSFVLDIINEERRKAIDRFIEFHKEFDDETYTITDGKRKTEEQVRRQICRILDIYDPTELIKMEKKARDKMVELLREEGLSIRQIERATGISRGIISKF